MAGSDVAVTAGPAGLDVRTGGQTLYSFAVGTQLLPLPPGFFDQFQTSFTSQYVAATQFKATKSVA